MAQNIWSAKVGVDHPANKFHNVNFQN